MPKQVNAQFPDESFARLQELAERMGLTVSALVRVAATEYLDNRERGIKVRDVLVNVMVSGMSVHTGPARPGQKPGLRENGATLKITGVPETATLEQVCRAVDVSAIWYYPDGPFEVPHDLLGYNKDGSISLINREKVEKYYADHPKD